MFVIFKNLMVPVRLVSEDDTINLICVDIFLCIGNK